LCAPFVRVDGNTIHAAAPPRLQRTTYSTTYLWGTRNGPRLLQERRVALVTYFSVACTHSSSRPECALPSALCPSPLYRTPLDSRQRGAVVFCAGFAAMLAATAESEQARRTRRILGLEGVPIASVSDSAARLGTVAPPATTGWLGHRRLSCLADRQRHGLCFYGGIVS